MEILKDRPAWFRDCRRHEVYTMLPTGNGGTIELLYTQVSFFSCSIFLFRSIWLLFRLKKKFNIFLDICSNNTGSCTGFLDPQIHHKFRQWKHCGMQLKFSRMFFADHYASLCFGQWISCICINKGLHFFFLV